MLDRATGKGILIREREAANCLQFAIGNIQTIRLDAGHLAAIIIVKSRQIVSIHRHIVLTGGLLVFGYAKLIPTSGQLPENLVFTLVPVQTDNAALPEGANEEPSWSTLWYLPPVLFLSNS